MKNLKTTITILALSIFVISCSKSDDKPNTTNVSSENFLTGFLATTGLNQQTTNNVNTAIFTNNGIKFSPIIAGKITKIRVKMPNTGNVSVKIWEETAANTGVELKSESVTVTQADTEAVLDITPLQISPSKKYCITFFTKNSYTRRRTDATDITYPITTGNIKIVGCAYINSTNDYPNIVSSNQYYGDISFDFTKD
jgi:Domain of unknown function (DUF4082)